MTFFAGWLTVFLISLIVVITPGRVCSEFWVNPALILPQKSGQVD